MRSRESWTLLRGREAGRGSGFGAGNYPAPFFYGAWRCASVASFPSTNRASSASTAARGLVKRSRLARTIRCRSAAHDSFGSGGKAFTQNGPEGDDGPSGPSVVSVRTKIL